MAVNLTGVVGDLSSLIPSSSDILQQVLLGAGASVVLAGLKTQAGVDAVDPLHIFHKDGGSTVVGKTIPASAFASLDANGKSAVLAAGYVITGG
jgi:hypothetical protein